MAIDEKNDHELYRIMRRWLFHAAATNIKRNGRYDCGGDQINEEGDGQCCCVAVLGGCLWFRFHARTDSKALHSLFPPDPSWTTSSSFRRLFHWAIQGMATETMMLACLDALIVMSNAMFISTTVPIIPERIVTILMEEVLKAYLLQRETSHHDEVSSSAAVVRFLARQIQGHFILLNILQPHQQEQQQQTQSFALSTACLQKERSPKEPNESFLVRKSDWRFPFVERLQETWTNSILAKNNNNNDSSYDDQILPLFLSRHLPRLCVGLLQAYAQAMELLQDAVFAQCRLERMHDRQSAVTSWIMDGQWLVEQSRILGLGGGGANNSRHTQRVFLRSSVSCMAHCLLEEYATRMLMSSSFSSSLSLQSANEPGSHQEYEDMGRAHAYVGLHVLESLCDGYRKSDLYDDAFSSAHLAMMLLESAEVCLARGLFARMSRVAMALRYVALVLHVRRSDELKQQARKAFQVYHSMKQDFAPHRQKFPETASQLLSMKRNMNDIANVLFVVQGAFSALVVPDKGLDFCTNRLKEEFRAAYQLIGLMAEVLLAKSKPKDLDLASHLLTVQDVLSGLVFTSKL
jgi:hypothetical protein